MPFTLEASTNRMGLLVDEGWVSSRPPKACKAISNAGKHRRRFGRRKNLEQKVKLN
jgi:hypothetical protein